MEERVPEIRFKDFEESWNKCKLNEYLDVSTEKNIDGIYSKNDVLSVSGDYGIVNQIAFQGRSFAGASVLKYGVVHTNDVVYTKSPLNANPYGIIKTNKGSTGIVSTLYAIYHPKVNTYANFVQVYFEQNARMNNYMHPLVNKGAKNDMKVSAENALKGIVYFPYFKEQMTISSFFTALDTLISLNQQKLDKLKTFKKSCLEKMFPKEGETVPEVRFKGFEGPWEKKKLGEVFQEYSEKNHDELSPLMIVQGGGTVKRDESDRNLSFDKANLSNYKMVNKGDFIVHLRSFEGGLEMATTKGIISPAYHTFHGENIDPIFYYSYFRSKKFIDNDLKPHVYGIRDGRSIDIEGMKTISIPYTSYQEQQQIGNYIFSIDKLLGLFQHKLDQLKNLKKALLDKMFV